MSNPSLVLGLAVAGCIVGAGTVGFLVYKGKLDVSKAAMLWAGLGALLAALVTGWRAGRHASHDKDAAGSQTSPPPEPTVGKVATDQVVKDTGEKIKEITDAEKEKDRLERLRRLTEGGA